MRKVKSRPVKVSKNHMSKFHQLQRIKALTKAFMEQQFKSSLNLIPKFNGL